MRLLFPALLLAILFALRGTRATQDSAESVPPLPQSGRIGDEQVARNAPFLIARPDASVTLGCVAWTAGEGDRLELRDVLRADGSSDPPRVVSDAPDEIVRPVAVADAKGRLLLLWTRQVDGRAQLACARELDESRAFSPPELLTSGPQPNLNPEAAALPDGRIFVAWEADVAADAAATDARPDRDVLLAPMTEAGKLGAPIRVGDGRFSDLDACVVATASRLWVVWAAYTGRDYEIRLRSFDPKSGALGETIDVSADSTADDLHPCVVAHGDDLWIAWDRVEVAQRGNSAPAELRVAPCPDRVRVAVKCACVRDGRVVVPASSQRDAANGAIPGPGESLKMSAGGGMPRLAFDRAGRLWVAYRCLSHSGRMGTTFPLLLQCLTKEGWSEPLEVARSGALTEQAALIAQGDGVLAAAYCDRHGESEEPAEVPAPLQKVLAKQGVEAGCWYDATAIGLAVTWRAKEDAGEPQLVPLAPTGSRKFARGAGFDPDDPILSGASHFQVQRGDDRWLVLWGDLHRHSSISRCLGGIEPTPADRWAAGRDVHLCDFMAVTDHSSHTEPFSWWQLDKLVWLYGSDRFCTLSGYEWSTGKWGHHNVILAGRLTPFLGRVANLDQLYEQLPRDQAITIPHHSAHYDFPVPFERCDDGFSRLVEIYQAMRGSYEFDGCFKQAVTATVLGSFVQDALADGREFGIIASTDHGFGQAYACALAKKLDRASVFEALHARRTYGATTKGILVDFRVGDALMGERTALAGKARVHVAVRGAAELSEVAIFKDGRPFQVVGARREKPSTFAPLRLTAQLPAGAPAPDHDWTLQVHVRDAQFNELEDRRHRASPAAAGGDPDGPDADVDWPRWTVARETATFLWPAGFAPSASNEFAVHVFLPEDARFELTAPDVAQKLNSARLLRGAIKLASDSGVSLALRAGDAMVDLDHGLGVRQFEQEWEDDAPSPGSKPSWYYARVIQTDGEMAWSSPVFVAPK